MEKAVKAVQNMSADLGGTEILMPLTHIYNQSCIPNQPRQVKAKTQWVFARIYCALKLGIRATSHFRGVMQVQLDPVVSCVCSMDTFCCIRLHSWDGSYFYHCSVFVWKVWLILNTLFHFITSHTFYCSLQLFVFTDGEVGNTKEVIDLVKKNSGSHRWSCKYLEWPRKTHGVLIVFVLCCVPGVSPLGLEREPALLSSMDWLKKEEATPSSSRGLTGCSPKWDHC